MDPKQMNSIELAFLGDAVYEEFVRERLVRRGFSGGHADRLHREAVRYVKAEAQAAIVKALMEQLSEEEQHVVTRARNHKIATKAKNASATDYKWATGFEALIGYLKLSCNEDRLLEIMEMAVNFIADQN
ncbi:MAG: ribonuclease III [Firmicutes bacterium]|nr:ribonuclease III [Bacillota bacterium]